MGLSQVRCGFDVHYIGNEPRIGYAHPAWSKEWCLKCRAEFRVVDTRDFVKKPETEIPTLEEFLREIMREEIANSTGAR